MGLTRTAVIAAAIALVAGPGVAAAQTAASPGVGLMRLSSPNAAGWHNSVVQLEHLCNAGVACPPDAKIADDGIHRLEYPLYDWDALADPFTLKIDRTAPTVRLFLPEHSDTNASAIDVVAEVADALSGVAQVECNGVAAAVAPDGRVRCRITLLPGTNDVVVEAYDAAGNSGSAGARVTRTGPARTIRILPELAAIGVGETLRLQVLDDFHRERHDVEWFVDRADVAATPDDGATVRGLSPGTMVVTATAGGLQATATITVFEGSEPPVGAVIYKANGVSVVHVPPVPKSTGPKHGPIGGADSASGARLTMSAQTERTGLIEWIEIPAVNDDEVGRRLYRHGPGGLLLVIERRDGEGSSLVRGGPSPGVRPWRYRSSGRLRPEMVVDSNGTIFAFEIPESGFPQLIVLDANGRVNRRLPLLPGIRVERDVDCVAGHGRYDRLPAEVGPPALHADGSVSFEYALGRDVLDACNGGTLVEQQRRLELLHIAADGVHTHLLREYDAPPDATLPAVDLLPVLLGRDGVLLAPWRLTADGSPTLSRVTRVPADGVTEEFELPAVGVLVPGEDVVATTDGTTLLVFHPRTGRVRWVQQPPGGDVAILEIRGNMLLTREGHRASARQIDGSRPAIP